MKHAMALMLAFLFLYLEPAAAQADKKQKEVALKFLNHMLKGQAENCWQLLDRANIPKITKQQFLKVVEQSKKQLSFIKTLVFDTVEIKTKNDKQLNQYFFRINPSAKDSAKKSYMVVSLFESSLLVADLSNITRETKGLPSPPTSVTGKMESIKENFSINIDSNSYSIKSFGLVYFDSLKSSSMRVQIDYPKASELSNKKEFAKQEAINIMKDLSAKGYIKQASARAMELNKELYFETLILFIDPIKGTLYPVLVTTDDYSK